VTTRASTRGLDRSEIPGRGECFCALRRSRSHHHRADAITLALAIRRVGAATSGWAFEAGAHTEQAGNWLRSGSGSSTPSSEGTAVHLREAQPSRSSSNRTAANTGAEYESLPDRHVQPLQQRA
jgi:hypothetical protein